MAIIRETYFSTLQDANDNKVKLNNDTEILRVELNKHLLKDLSNIIQSYHDWIVEYYNYDGFITIPLKGTYLDCFGVYDGFSVTIVVKALIDGEFKMYSIFERTFGVITWITDSHDGKNKLTYYNDNDWKHEYV